MLLGSSKRRRTNSSQRQDSVEVDTDSGNSDEGWVECKKASKHHLPRLGDPILCTGATFTVSRKYSRKFLYGDDLEVGKIHSVVRRHGSSVPHFKFYNLLDYTDQPPAKGSASYMYCECEKMMSTSEKKTGIKWTAKNSSAPKNRPRKQFFEKEYGLATRGVYDKEDQLDALRRKKQLKRQQNSESDSSSDEDEPYLSESERNSSDGEREFTSTKVTAVDLDKADWWIDEEWYINIIIAYIVCITICA